MSKRKINIIGSDDERIDLRRRRILRINPGIDVTRYLDPRIIAAPDFYGPFLSSYCIRPNYGTESLFYVTEEGNIICANHLESPRLSPMFHVLTQFQIYPTCVLCGKETIKIKSAENCLHCVEEYTENSQEFVREEYVEVINRYRTLMD